MVITNRRHLSDSKRASEGAKHQGVQKMSSVSVQNSVGDGPRDQLQPMGLENQNNMLVEDNSS